MFWRPPTERTNRKHRLRPEKTAASRVRIESDATAFGVINKVAPKLAPPDSPPSRAARVGLPRPSWEAQAGRHNRPRELDRKALVALEPVPFQSRAESRDAARGKKPRRVCPRRD